MTASVTARRKLHLSMSEVVVQPAQASPAPSGGMLSCQQMRQVVRPNNWDKLKPHGQQALCKRVTTLTTVGHRIMSTVLKTSSTQPQATVPLAMILCRKKVVSKQGWLKVCHVRVQDMMLSSNQNTFLQATILPVRHNSWDLQKGEIALHRMCISILQLHLVLLHTATLLRNIPRRQLTGCSHS